ncbi:MAG: bifunctional glutamate N-acetyltransferase/amino-acid acetyltransferase ArgJ, partial [Christensenellales bacterium]
INSGNANTCTGEDGKKKAYKMTELTAEKLKIKKEDVLVASTGIIGLPLDIGAIENGMDNLVQGLSKNGYDDASQAILTTDTEPKSIAVTVEIGGKSVSIGAMAKGSGMIHPNMATMLSFITTDLNIKQQLLQEALRESVNKTYNRISVDGDTSTNDMVVILANGEADNPLIDEKNADYDIFFEALNYINTCLSKLIARDGEGATKLIECEVKGATSESKAEILAKSVIKSNLVKTACFGADANWGRILCALGYSNIPLNAKKIDVAFESSKGYIEVYQKGMPIIFDEKKAKLILEDCEIKIIVNLNEGEESATAWGCDLTYEYVRINGDYRS